MNLIKNYINGQWIDAISGKTTKGISPGTGEVIYEVVSSGREDAKAAIQAAKESFYGKGRGEWRRMSPPERADILYKVAQLIDKRREEIARAECMDQGKPLPEAEADVDDTIAVYKYYAGVCGKPHGTTFDVHEGLGPVQAQTVKEPVGVCALICPWNYPLTMGAWKLAPALAAGNSVVFKPASITPWTTSIVFEIFEEAGIPAGAANLVLGSGSTVGMELAESMDVDMVTFTGSTETGRTIMKAAASNIKKIGLELGGKSPNIVFADIADDEQTFEDAVEWAQMGVFFTSGQVCCSPARLVIEKSIKDKFVKRLLERVSKMTLDNPMNGPDMGALASEDHMNTVLNYIEIGKKEGAKLLCGGYRYTEGACANGFFVAPTIFDDCTPDMTIVKEEIFGPVMVIQTFETEEEAIDLANDTIYGLAGAVFTRDAARALRVTKELRAGICWINMCNVAYVESPWGGYKQSGIGRELSVDGFDEYCETKAIHSRLEPSQLGAYKG